MENISNPNSSGKQYWLLGYSFGSNKSQHNRFIDENIWEAYYDENDIRQIDLTRKIQIGDVIILKSSSTKGPKHNLPFVRVKSIGIVTDVQKDEVFKQAVYFKLSVNYLQSESRDFDGSSYGRFRQTIHKCDDSEILVYANSIIENNVAMAKTNIQTYIDFLKENKNIILHGAPGTGKTYLAKQIAEAMGAEAKLVQFHQSYDYTDFVEGLRPKKSIKGEIGFDLMKGVFKKFCESAILSKSLSNKSDGEDIFKDLNESPVVWKVSLEGTGDNPTRKECLDNNHIRIGWDKYGDVDFEDESLTYPEGGKSILKTFQSKMKIGDIVVSCYSEKVTDAIGIITGDYEYKAEGGLYPRYRNVNWLVKNIKEDIVALNGNKVMTLSTVYKLNITPKDILEVVNKHTKPIKPVSSSKPFIFIIDEINRGEMSKIFGELFFSIDPGYRGEKGKVSTQYQNLIEDGDTFKSGFYVPENVYIIGTMNDIDRSVESMDFAMRRRFSFMEITAEESAENMNLDDEQKFRMKNLNNAIDEIEGLNSSFHIGGAYYIGVNDFDKLWKFKLKGLIKEYLRGMNDEKGSLEFLKKAFFKPLNPVTNDNNNDGQ